MGALMPVETGIQVPRKGLDTGLRRCDERCVMFLSLVYRRRHFVPIDT